MADFVTLIAGNICAGKTELIRYIKSRITAPDDVTEETIRENALRLFYLAREAHNDEVKAITCMVEDSFLADRLMNHLEIKHAPGIRYIDRGILEGVETFAYNSYQEGNLIFDDWEYDIRRKARKGLDQLDRREQKKWLEQLVVYLKAEDATTLYERYKQRNRQDELIRFDYLQRLNEQYEHFFKNYEQIYSEYGLQAPELLIIPASIDFSKETLSQFHAQAWEKIQRKMKEMKPDG